MNLQIILGGGESKNKKEMYFLEHKSLGLFVL